MAKKFSHLDAAGRARMVDVGRKPVQSRVAIATGELHCAPSTLEALKKQNLPKGDALAVARIAGIQAAKKTPDLIPLCHSLPLDQAGVDFELLADRILIRAEVRTTAKTGVEMEALSAVCVAALTLFDMMKAVDKTMRIEKIRVVKKVKRSAGIPPASDK